MKRFVDGSGPKIRNVEVGRHIKYSRSAPDGAAFDFVGMRDSQVQAMAVDERRNNSAIHYFLGAAAMVRLSLPGAGRLVSIPLAFDPQTFFIVGAAAVAMRHGA